jgi:pyrophosphatase PpaX
MNTMIFDMDGTIADTIPLTIYAIKETVRKLTNRLMGDAEVLRHFGPTDIEIIRNLCQERPDEGVETYVEMYQNAFHAHVSPIDGMKELLAFLKNRSFQTALFTGRGKRVTMLTLKLLDLEGYFDVIITGDDVTQPKPDPEGILTAITKLQSIPSKSAYVGDFDVDILASKKAGVVSVLALWSKTKDEALKEYCPDQYFYTPKEMMHWLSSL